MTPTTDQHDHNLVRRQRARRTALWFALAAVAIYVGFILMGVLVK